jgi:hypothetical protein
MKSKKLWLSLALLGVTIATASAIVLLRPFVAYGGRPVVRGEGAAFRYGGHVVDNGEMHIVVSVDLNDPKALQAYRDANTARGRALIARGEAKAIWVQVTFARPLPADEVRTLVEETGFEVENYLRVGRASNGERVIHIRVGPIGDDVPETVYDPLWNVEKTYAGIMTLQGTVETTERGLGRWLVDERVYLIDTTGEEVRELATQRHASAVAGREIVVGVESPYWNFDW